jgi:hypothetical protein
MIIVAETATPTAAAASANSVVYWLCASEEAIHRSGGGEQFKNKQPSRPLTSAAMLVASGRLCGRP